MSLLRRRKEAETAPDLEGLREYIRKKDRQSPLHFAGRCDEIKAILASLRLARDGGGAGLTEVVTAAPGGGKSALLGEIARRCRASGEADAVEFGSPRIFADPARAMTEFLRQLDPKAAARVGAQTDTAGGGARVAGIGAQKSRALTRDLRPRRFREALGLTRRKDPAKPVAVLIDEAQGFPAGDGPAELLLEAHQAEGGVPVLLVLAGLGDTRGRLAECGLSKDATDERDKVLEGLSPEECREVAQDFFKRFRIAGGGALRAEWTEALTGGTDGWPRHLTNALRGAAKAIIEGEGDLAQASLRDALDSAEAYRRQYYKSQLRPFAAMPELLEEVVKLFPGKDSRASAAAISRAIRRAHANAPHLAEEMSRAEVFARLQHKGVIQEFADGGYGCPIPSFRAYIEEFCAEHAAPGGEPEAGSEPHPSNGWTNMPT